MSGVISPTKILNRSGPKLGPCGIQDVTCISTDRTPPYRTDCFLSVEYDEMKRSIFIKIQPIEHLLVDQRLISLPEKLCNTNFVDLL